METVIKAGIIAGVCWAVYALTGAHFPETHKYAFGAAGAGFSYLFLATCAAGLVTYKFVK